MYHRLKCLCGVLLTIACYGPVSVTAFAYRYSEDTC